jgi:hypothetical protein
MGGEEMSDPHYPMRSAVTRFSHGVPTEVACVCGGCPDHPTILGHGATLPECSADLKANFAKHSEATP